MLVYKPLHERTIEEKKSVVSYLKPHKCLQIKTTLNYSNQPAVKAGFKIPAAALIGQFDENDSDVISAMTYLSFVLPLLAGV